VGEEGGGKEGEGAGERVFVLRGVERGYDDLWEGGLGGGVGVM